MFKVLYALKSRVLNFLLFALGTWVNRIQSLLNSVEMLGQCRRTNPQKMGAIGGAVQKLCPFMWGQPPADERFQNIMFMQFPII